jgi:hypothetical protein
MNINNPTKLQLAEAAGVMYMTYINFQAFLQQSAVKALATDKEIEQLKEAGGLIRLLEARANKWMSEGK